MMNKMSYFNVLLYASTYACVLSIQQEYSTPLGSATTTMALSGKHRAQLGAESERLEQHHARHQMHREWQRHKHTQHQQAPQLNLIENAKTKLAQRKQPNHHQHRHYEQQQLHKHHNNANQQQADDNSDNHLSQQRQHQHSEHMQKLLNVQHSTKWHALKKPFPHHHHHHQHEGSLRSSQSVLGISKNQQNNDNPRLYLEAVTTNTHNTTPQPQQRRRHQHHSRSSSSSLSSQSIVKPLHFTDTSFLLNPKSIMSTHEHTQESFKQKLKQQHKIKNSSSANIENKYEDDDDDYSYYDDSEDDEEEGEGEAADDHGMHSEADDKAAAVEDDDDEGDSDYDNGNDNDDDEDDAAADYSDIAGIPSYNSGELNYNDYNDNRMDDNEYNDYNDKRMSRHENTRVPRDYHHNHNSDFGAQDSMENMVQDAPTSNHPRNYTLTDEKFTHYGTQEAVQRSHQRFFAITDYELAKKHSERMANEARCKHPMKRVIYISNETSRTYVPRCTILYRCGDDTGCCRSITHVCTNKTSELIDISVFVSEGARAPYVPTKIAMYNHTECHCVNRASLYDTMRPRDKRASASAIQSRLSAINLRHTQESKAQSAAQTNCQCPTHFSSMTQQQHADNVMGQQPCYCDCLSDNVTCQRLKNGVEGFALDDRRRIHSDKCQIPTCSFGKYNTLTGRCPRQSQFEGIG